MKMNRPRIVGKYTHPEVDIGDCLEIIGCKYVVIGKESGNVFVLKEYETGSGVYLLKPHNRTMILLTKEEKFVCIAQRIYLLDDQGNNVSDVRQDGDRLVKTVYTESKVKCPSHGIAAKAGMKISGDVYLDGELFASDVESDIKIVSSDSVGEVAVVSNKFGVFMTSDMESFISVNGMGFVFKYICDD